MTIEVKKKQGETTRSLLRRFTRRIQQSGVLIRARKARFLEKEKSKREKRISALRRERIGKEKEKLRKMGLLEEESKWGRR
ncbi:MAG: 30S ribosomal protein S21 [Candidatus Portnoybacteria bacterium]